jgi:hypothetical protein
MEIPASWLVFALITQRWTSALPGTQSVDRNGSGTGSLLATSLLSVRANWA